MPRTTMAAQAAASNGATLGIERQLWATADKLRGHLNAADYKHVVLGLIFLKYISDNCVRRHAELEALKSCGRGTIIGA